MRVKLFSVLILAAFFSSSVFAQGKLKLDRSIIDFGEVKDWNNPTANFTFKNAGNRDLMFLPTRPSQNVQVRLPKGFIKPGQVSVIEVTFYTNVKGVFNIKIPVYTNGSAEPQNLRIKGDIKSFHPNAMTQCPTFNEEIKTDFLKNEQVVKVIDSKTGLPIENAHVQFYQGKNKIASKETDKHGKLKQEIPIGLYMLQANAENYFPVEEPQYLKRSADVIVIPLDPYPTPNLPVYTKAEPVKKEDYKYTPIQWYCMTR